MRSVFICLLILGFGIAFAETMGLSDYFKVEFEEVVYTGDHSRFDPVPGPDTVVQGDTIIYKVRVENVYTRADSQSDITVQLTFPNMWVNPPETPRLFCDFIGGGVVSDLAHSITDTTSDYAIWNFTSIPRTAARTIVCSLQVRDDICGSVVNDLNLMAFAQVVSDESEPTMTADLSDGLTLSCRPGLSCGAEVGEVSVSSNQGDTISVSSGDPLYIEINGSNFPYNDVNANNCLFYVLLPPDAIAQYQSATPTPGGILTIGSGHYAGWRLIWWDVDLLADSSYQKTVYFSENDGTMGECFNAYSGVLWDPNPDVLWDSGSGEPNETVVYNPISEFICMHTLTWCLLSPDLVISVESPFDTGCVSCGWPVSFDWTVTNVGTGIANADPLIIEFTSDGTLIGTEVIPGFSLSTGNSISGTVPIANPVCGDTIAFCAVVDANNVVQESDETNNSQCDELCIGITEINVDIINVSIDNPTTAYIDACDETLWATCDSPLALISVTDQNGYPITGLADECWGYPHDEWTALAVIEASGTVDLLTNCPQLRMFAADEDILPLSVAIIMDYSGSMSSSACALAEASVQNYIERDLCAERFAIIKFGTDVEVKCDFSDDIDGTVIPAVNLNDYTGGGGTNILGAVQVGLNLIEDDTGGYRHIVIVFSDGCDGSTMPMSEVIEHANLVNASIFTIGLGSYDDRGYLEALANGTGGLYRHVDTPDEMEPLYLFFCNAASYFYAMQFCEEWTCALDSLIATVELQNSTTFNTLLSGTDTMGYNTCCPICDLTINKHSSGLPLDTLLGVPFADTNDVISYRISATNFGQDTCSCDTIRIVDYLPTWAGTPNCGSISPTPVHCDSDSIVWEINSNEILSGYNYILEFSFNVTNNADILNNGPSPYIVNCVKIECEDDVDITNNSDCDSVVVKLVPDPSIICEYLANSNHWPGDMAIINVACPLPTLPVNWEAWFETSCIVGDLPEPFANQASDTLERMGFADTIVLPQLAEGCNTGEIWAYIQVRYDFMDTTIFYTDSCMLEVRRPPCRVRIDKNQINDGDEVMVEITQCDASDVRVQVINIAGDIVAEPLNESFAQGLFKFYWDGKDDMGHPVNSGVYGILVKAGDEFYTFKLAVIR